MGAMQYMRRLWVYPREKVRLVLVSLKLEFKNGNGTCQMQLKRH
jgi:hypothetical protein